MALPREEEWGSAEAGTTRTPMCSCHWPGGPLGGAGADAVAAVLIRLAVAEEVAEATAVPAMEMEATESLSTWLQLLVRALHEEETPGPAPVPGASDEDGAGASLPVAGAGAGALGAAPSSGTVEDTVVTVPRVKRVLMPVPMPARPPMMERRGAPGGTLPLPGAAPAEAPSASVAAGAAEPDDDALLPVVVLPA